MPDEEGPSVHSDSGDHLHSSGSPEQNLVDESVKPRRRGPGRKKLAQLAAGSLGGDSPSSPPADPPGTAPHQSQGEDGPEQQLAAFLRQFFAQEILPSLRQHTDQTLAAGLTEIRAWVSQQILSLTPPVLSDTQTLAKQVGDMLAPQLQRDFEPLVQMVQALEVRLGALEGRSDPANIPAAPGLNQVQAAQGPEAGPPDRVAMIASVAESLVDVAVQKLLPAINSFQQLRQSNRLFSMDPAAIEAFRKANPAYAMILAQQLAPDATVAGLMAQLPFTLATGIATGMKARVMAGQLIAREGTTWPGTLGPGSPGSSPSTPGGLLPTPTVPRTGASMQQLRPRLGRLGRPSNARFKHMPTNGVGPAAPAKLSDLLK